MLHECHKEVYIFVIVIPASANRVYCIIIVFCVSISTCCNVLYPLGNKFTALKIKAILYTIHVFWNISISWDIPWRIPNQLPFWKESSHVHAFWMWDLITKQHFNAQVQYFSLGHALLISGNKGKKHLTYFCLWINILNTEVSVYSVFFSLLVFLNTEFLIHIWLCFFNRKLWILVLPHYKIMASAAESFDIEKVRNEVSKINSELFCRLTFFKVFHFIIIVILKSLKVALKIFFKNCCIKLSGRSMGTNHRYRRYRLLTCYMALLQTHVNNGDSKWQLLQGKSSSDHNGPGKGHCRHLFWETDAPN